MAKNHLAPPAAEAAPDIVQLHCEDLGKTRDFTQAHAKALLAFQEHRGLKGSNSWQPVAADEAKSE